MKRHCFIIAEAGVNHNGDPYLAERLIDAAAEAGADAVKFQTFHADQLAAPNLATTAYQQENSGKKTQQEMLARLELDEPAHRRLRDHAIRRNIEFLSTPFDPPSIELLERLDLPRFKVPSGQITDVPYLERIGRTGKPVILSTGMATLGEVEHAIEILTRAGTPRKAITLLHATTAYPTPMDQVNLRAMQTLGSAFELPYGYSDHTRGIEVAIAAVALGACVIEKHVTLDRTLPGPDHAASLEPPELTAMISAIRNVERALGSALKQPTPVEKTNAPLVRKRIVASTFIRKGESFSEGNLTTRRAPLGICASRWHEVIGLPADREYRPGEGVLP